MKQKNAKVWMCLPRRAKDCMECMDDGKEPGNVSPLLKKTCAYVPARCAKCPVTKHKKGHLCADCMGANWEQDFMDGLYNMAPLVPKGIYKHYRFDGGHTYTMVE